MLKLGIATPVVTMNPNYHAAWEKDATVDDIGRIGEVADRLGYDHMTCSEHIGVPAAEAPRRGARYWDPLATFGYLAARTERIRFLTMVLVLGYHHPLEIAKRYGTLDLITGGRLTLGLGVGTLKEEFDLIGAPFDDRGARADDALRALRASLSQSDPVYHGEYYSFEGLTIEPCAVQAKVPLWVGGRSLLSLRRAVKLADGWTPFAVSAEQAVEWLAQVEVPAGFDIALSPGKILDPMNEPGQAQEALAALAAAGATVVHAGLRNESLEHYLEQLEALTAANAAL